MVFCNFSSTSWLVFVERPVGGSECAKVVWIDVAETPRSFFESNRIFCEACEQCGIAGSTAPLRWRLFSHSPLSGSDCLECNSTVFACKHCAQWLVVSIIGLVYRYITCLQFFSQQRYMFRAVGRTALVVTTLEFLSPSLSSGSLQECATSIDPAPLSLRLFAPAR